MEAEWVVAISSGITALGIVFIAIQTSIAAKQLAEFKKQIAADHQRSRINKAIDVLNEWTKSLDKAHPSARTLVNGFTIEQCEKLKEKTPFDLPVDKRSLLENVLHGHTNGNPLSEDDKSVTLNEDHLSHIYFLCMTHLNSLEIALQSWMKGVADKGIIEEEMCYLIKPEKEHYILENFRKVIGGKDIYPAIHAFVEHINLKAEIDSRSDIKGNIA